MKEVTDELAFWFCNSNGFVGIVAHSLAEFSKCLRTAPVDSLEFHFRDDKNDFEAWLNNVMGEPKLAASADRLKKKALAGEKLRASVLRLARRIEKLA